MGLSQAVPPRPGEMAIAAPARVLRDSQPFGSRGAASAVPLQQGMAPHATASTWCSISRREVRSSARGPGEGKRRQRSDGGARAVSGGHRFPLTGITVLACVVIWLVLPSQALKNVTHHWLDLPVPSGQQEYDSAGRFARNAGLG